MRKYRNKPQIVDGIRFDSKKEAARYGELKLLVAAGKISQLKVQPRYKLQRGCLAIKYPNGRIAAYTADFEYFDIETGEKVTEDCKGFFTQEAKLRIAVFESLYRRKVLIT